MPHEMEVFKKETHFEFFEGHEKFESGNFRSTKIQQQEGYYGMSIKKSVNY